MDFIPGSKDVLLGQSVAGNDLDANLHDTLLSLHMCQVDG